MEQLLLATYGAIVGTIALLWKSIETVRNRPNIKVDVDLLPDGVVEHNPEGEPRFIKVVASNDGRYPIHLLSAGFQFSNGERHEYPVKHQTFPQWLYSKAEPIQVLFFINELKEMLSAKKTTIEFAYFIDEKAVMHKGKIPKNVEQVLYH